MNLWETLAPARRERLETGEAALKALHRGETIERWHMIGDAANELQLAAMDAARTNKPTGKGYNAAWADLATHVPHIRDLNSPTRAHAMWLATNWEAVDRWLHTLAVDTRMRIAHPTAIKRRYDAAHVVPEQKDAAPDKLSPMAQAKQTIMQLQDEVDRLQRVADGGSLFDLKGDTAAQIARVIVNTIGDHKVGELIKALSAGRTDKRRKRAAQAG